MNKLSILLQQLHIDTNQAFSQADITRVVVHHDSRYTFYISSPELMPLDNVKALKEAQHLFPYPCEFLFETTSNHFREEDVIEYSDYIMHHVLGNVPEMQSMTRDDMDLKDNILTLHTVNHIQCDSIKTQLNEMRTLLSGFGINIDLRAEVDADNHEYQQTIAKMEENKGVHIDSSALEKYNEAMNEAPSAYSKPAGNYKRYKKEYVMTQISQLDNTMREVAVQGYCFQEETTQTKSGKHIQTLLVTDYSDSIMVKRFENKNRNTLEEMEQLKKGGKWIRVKGTFEYDSFAREQVIIATEIEIIPAPKPRIDKAEKKRVELHCHSNMSTMDGIATVGSYIKRATEWGMSAIAVTDHGNVQSFPDAQAAAGDKLKMIYGVEMNMIDTNFDCVFNANGLKLKDLTYVSFDLETTGLSQIDDHITEIGAVKIKNGLEVGRLQTFIKSPKPISKKITELTSITNEDIRNAPTIEEFMPKLMEFFGDNLLIAHNGRFDIGMLDKALERMGKEPIQNPWIDTLPLSRRLIPLMRSYRLGAVCRFYHIPYDTEAAHRADYDAEVLSHSFNVMLQDLIKKGFKTIDEINDIEIEDSYKHAFPYHMCVLAKTPEGLKNMFRLVSIANTKYFHQCDRIPRSELEFYREGLIFGSGCLNSKVFEIASTRDEEELREEIRFYDYVEIQPLEDAMYLVDRGKYDSIDDIERIYKRIIKIAKEENKLICATGDVHFLDKRDKVYREVFITNSKIQINGKPHPLLVRNNPRALTPDVYLRTTDEMLECFPYLSDEDTYEYVVTNTNKIADMIGDDIIVTKEGLYPPSIENVDKKLRELCHKNAHETYGEVLPEIVSARLEKELSNIIKHGFAVIYFIASELVRVSNEAGYLVGSRGSVGSSFVATMAGISEVNPLAPHYICPHCKHNEFLEEGVISDGYDLPDKNCPVCGHKMKGEGHNIPFETFLGFNADKVPDIDLNFSGEYQPKAHAYTKTIFGEDHVFRAGTISTVAEKTAYGYARAYAENLGLEDHIRSAELQRLANGCTGVKRTTGQHPGGIIVIPNDMEVFDFTPYQYPADDVNAEWRTTHFDFHKIHDNVLKFDILGHVDPTVIRMLQDMTGVDPKSIPTNDQKVMSLFNSSKALGCDLSFLNCKTGALGLPEFGTKFVRGMLEQTHPKSFNELVIISGLSHGTDVYLGNAETLIKSGTCTLQQVIGCRDDIMVYLIEKGLPNKDAFDIMECVRKGKSPKVFPQKGYVELMKKHNVPQWYIDSCLKIKYMFPKAHAVAYVLSAIRVAWWKLYYPREYYAVYFTTRCDFYDIETLIAGKEAVYDKYQECLKLKAEHKASNKEEGLITVFEVALEMFERGLKFSKISLDQSDSRKFICHPDDPTAIIPPFTSIDGLGDAVGDSVVEARKERPFTSIEDIKKRTRLSGTHIETLQKMGVLNGFSESDQLTIFDL